MAIVGHPQFRRRAQTLATGDAGGFRNLRGCWRAGWRRPSPWPATPTISSITGSPRAGGREPLHHFVNGGGGAYLSIGTRRSTWPARTRAQPTGATYPGAVGAAREACRPRRRCGSDRFSPGSSGFGRLAVSSVGGAVGRLRFQPRAVLPEFHGGAGRALCAAYPPLPARRQRRDPLARSSNGWGDRARRRVLRRARRIFAAAAGRHGSMVRESACAGSLLNSGQMPRAQ